jgi:hypothetical protein
MWSFRFDVAVLVVWPYVHQSITGDVAGRTSVTWQLLVMWPFRFDVAVLVV